VGEMLEVWSVDPLQEMLDTPPLQHPSQVMKSKPSQQYHQVNQLSGVVPKISSGLNRLRVFGIV
jgi:hypothetical protein